jgi:glucose/mannose-6-phosphate isomerase
MFGCAPRAVVSSRAANLPGALRIRALAASLPTQLKAGFRAGRAIAPPASGRSTTVFSVGMGGSGISSELARAIVESETPVTIQVVRSPDLPRGVDRKSRVVLVSYSGDTWETLRGYDAAGRAGASRIVITSGGALADRAERDGVPVLTLPSGLPPRCAVGYVFGGVLGLLDPWFPESNEGRVDRVAEQLTAAIPRYARTDGPGAAIARRIGSRVPVVYSESGFVGLARRWKTQVEENAKRLAIFDELPELLHNAIVGWDATRTAEAARYAVVLLEWAGALPLTRRSFRYLERLLSQRGATVVSVPLAAEDRLEAVVNGIALGDQVSLFLAEQRGVDPWPIDAIVRFKAALASKSPR